MLSLRIYFFKDTTILASIVLAVFAIAGSWLMLFAIPRPADEDPFVILYYTIYFGIQRIGPWDSLFLLPFASSVCLVLQAAFAYVLYDRDRFWSYALVIGAALIAIIIFFVSLFLLTINV